MLSIKHVTMDTYHGNHATCDRVPLPHKIFKEENFYCLLGEFCKNLTLKFIPSITILSYPQKFQIHKSSDPLAIISNALSLDILD